MNHWIERYIHDVTRRLPENIREDVKNELSAHIEDMLPDHPSDDDVKSVLVQLGEPRLLANKYRGTERYLISPAHFDRYIYVLKIVLIVYFIVGLVTGTIDAIIDASDTWYGFIGDAVGNAIGHAIGSLLSAFAIVTLVFAAIDYKQVKLGKSEWDVKDLPDLPKSTSVKISRTNMTIGLAFGVVFQAIFIIALFRYQDYIGLWIDGTFIARFFNPEVVKFFLPLMLISLIAYTFVHIFIIYEGHYTKTNAVIFSIYQLLSAVLMIAFINHPNLIEPGFIEELSELIKDARPNLNIPYNPSRYFISVLVILGPVIETIRIWFKLYKSGALSDAVIRVEKRK